MCSTLSWVVSTYQCTCRQTRWILILHHKSHGRLLRYHTRGKDSEIVRLFQDALMIWKLEVLAWLWCDQLGDVCWHINTFRCHILSSVAHTWFDWWALNCHSALFVQYVFSAHGAPDLLPTFCFAKNNGKASESQPQIWRRISLVLGQQITELEIWLPAPGETYTLGAHWQIRPPSM